MSKDLSDFAYREVQDGNEWLEEQGFILRCLNMSGSTMRPRMLDNELAFAAFINGMECEVRWDLSTMDPQLIRFIARGLIKYSLMRELQEDLP